MFKLKFVVFILFSLTGLMSMTLDSNDSSYYNIYNIGINDFQTEQYTLIKLIESKKDFSEQSIIDIKKQLSATRIKLKGIDFWFRYLNPIAFHSINGPLPVEWETEVFEKFEKPYKREGAGLTLAALYLEEVEIDKKTLLNLIQTSIHATEAYKADSITKNLKTYHHFFLCNRLFLLNLAAIYTTGFECPDTSNVIPELRSMLNHVGNIYQSYNESFPNKPLSNEYLLLFNKTRAFVNSQSTHYSQFDNFTFIKEFVNPLFSLNQKLIREYKVGSRSVVDYTLNNNCNSLFDKKLYTGQNSKGIFIHVNDDETLAEIDRIGKLLFYDPILSGNNSRSCASCHKGSAFFTDTLMATSIQFNHNDFLTRNTPSLINVGFNHLIMMDGKHISLQDQAKAVICNPKELGSNEKEILQKVLSCNEYKSAFKKFLKYTPQEEDITFDHLVSAITFYYSKFSNYYSPFDNAMNENRNVDISVKQGFNLFMTKAQCATCHFVPQFNGVKPPYVSSEFEVLGVPFDSTFKKLDLDSGRYYINPADESLYAFRTGSIRNAEHTKPYMHNGVFEDLKQVIDFYDAGGGAGRGFIVNNQTLSADSLHLSPDDKNKLIAFIKSLNEQIIFEAPPEKLPVSKNKLLNTRKVGGTY